MAKDDVIDLEAVRGSLETLRERVIAAATRRRSHPGR